jgi:RecA-family ATPase
LETTTKFYEELTEYLTIHRISLVLIDTLGSFWDVEDENIATKVTKAIKPLVHLARTTETCILLLHHNRKSGGSAGSEIRGSSAIFAAVDVALIMKENGVETQRTIAVKSRYPNAPEKLLVELRKGTYIDLSSSQDAKQGQKDKIFSHMSEEFTTIKKIAELAELHYSTVSMLLKQMTEERKIRKKSGTGRGGQVLYAKTRPRVRLLPDR